MIYSLKTLLLFRHAKSSWDSPGLKDHDRPLAKRGWRAAPMMATRLAELDLPPDRVLCSTALRTRQTFDCLADVFETPPPVRFERELYAADPATLLEHLHRLDDAVDSAMLIGHNPGLEELAEFLAGSGDADALARMRTKFPTAAVAHLEFEVGHWSEIKAGAGRLVSFARPRDLEG